MYTHTHIYSQHCVISESRQSGGRGREIGRLPGPPAYVSTIIAILK